MNTNGDINQPAQSTPTQPSWWRYKNVSAWERVRDAFRRDWNQTQADFTGSLGHELNQTATDTVKQAVGPGGVPPLDVMTHPDTPTRIEVTQDRLFKDMKVQTRKVTGALRGVRSEKALLKETLQDTHAAAATEQREAEVEDASARSAKRIDEDRMVVAKGTAAHEDAVQRWRAMEPAARYGFTAHSQHPGQHEWSGPVEDALSAEWRKLSNGPSWEVAKDDVRRGWEYAGKEVDAETRHGDAKRRS
jgi:hypothetical protein